MDYLQTSAPTPAAASVKILMTVANEKGDKIYHLDVAQAFTKAELDCVVYMKLPGGCDDLSGKFVRLEKALYGLRQSGLLWNGLLFVKLVQVHGMERVRLTLACFA